MLVRANLVCQAEVLINVEQVKVARQLLLDDELQPLLVRRGCAQQTDRLCLGRLQAELQLRVDIVRGHLRHHTEVARAEEVVHQLFHEVAVTAHVEGLECYQMLDQVDLAIHHVQHALVDDLCLHANPIDHTLADCQVHRHLYSGYLVGTHFLFFVMGSMAVEGRVQSLFD